MRIEGMLKIDRFECEATLTDQKGEPHEIVEILNEAGFGRNESHEATISYNPGEVIIRTPEATARAENEATILDLMRLIYSKQRESLIGKNIRLQWSATCAPKFWGAQQSEIEGKIVAFMNEHLVVFVSIVNPNTTPVTLRPCDLLTAASIEIDLDKSVTANPADTSSPNKPSIGDGFKTGSLNHP